MKIYTEVNYIWKDNKLVKTDSKSFEYKGEVDQCHSRTKRIGNRYIGYKTVNIPHTHKSINDLKPKGGEAANLSNQLSETIDKNTDTVSQEFDRWDKAHKTNMKYAKEYIAALTGGILQQILPSEDEDEEGSLESGLGTRGTMAGRNTDASASTSKVRRDVNKKQGLAPTLINQKMQKRLQA